MAKAQTTPCKRKRKLKKFDFSESELDAAEQLIQLSGDSNNYRKDINFSNIGVEGWELISDSDSTHRNYDHPIINTPNKKFFEEDHRQNQTIVGFEQRKRIKFKYVCEIYIN